MLKMDQPKATLSRGALQPLLRHPRLAVFAMSATAVGMGIKYQADAIKKNEMAQKNSSMPNFYVSVERSGGGI